MFIVLNNSHFVSDLFTFTCNNKTNYYYCYFNRRFNKQHLTFTQLKPHTAEIKIKINNKNKNLIHVHTKEIFTESFVVLWIAILDSDDDDDDGVYDSIVMEFPEQTHEIFFYSQ